MVGCMNFDIEELARKFRSFRGVSLLVILVAGVLNMVTGLYPVGFAFIAIAIVLAIRLARQNPDDRRF